MFDLESFRNINLPSENDIMESWSSHVNTPVISIICTSYNQERYISDALRGFLIQKTTVPFEVVIHDDASTDNTREIIEYYAELYPAIIKPIFQVRNQYSIDGHLPFYNAIKNSLGEFVSLCEGDDFWICSDKLEKQYQLMLSNPDIDLCFTSALLMKNEVVSGIAANYTNSYKFFSVCNVIEKGGSFIPTASVFLRKKVLDVSFFSVIKDAPVGDYYLQIFGALNSGVILQGYPCSVYRVDAIDSWSANVRASDSLIKIENFVNGNEKTLLKILQNNSHLEESIKYAISNFYLSASKRAFKLGLIAESKAYLDKVSFRYNRSEINNIFFYCLCKTLPVKVIYFFMSLLRRVYDIQL